MTKLKKYLLMFSITLGSSLLINSNVFATEQVKVTRIYGQDRYETSTKITQSSLGWTESYYAVLCNGEAFADAVTSSPLAVKFKAPILLVQKDSIPENIKQELIRLKTKKVFIVGGEGIVSNKVINELSNMGISIEMRVAGQDRHETSAKMSHYIIGERSCFLVEGEDWRNALAVAPVACWKQDPILLTGKGTMPESIKQKNLSYQYNNLYVMAEKDDQYNLEYQAEYESGIPFYQLTFGNDKTDTNIEIYNSFKNVMDFNKIFLVSSKGFADGLCASNIAGENRNLIWFVDENNIERIITFLNQNAIKTKEIVVVGSKQLIPQSWVDAIQGDAQRKINKEEYEEQQRQKNRNEIQIYVEDDTPEGKARKEENEYLTKYSEYLNKYGITKEQAIKIAIDKTNIQDLDVYAEGYAGIIDTLDTGEDIQNRRFYSIYSPSKQNEGIHYLVDKEDGKLYKQIELGKNVYTLYK